MKNIIGWTDATEAFKDRLRKRLRLVLAPLLRARAAQDAVRTQERVFHGMSTNEQVRGLFDAAGRLVEDRGYKPFAVPADAAPHEVQAMNNLYRKTHRGIRRQLHLVASVQIPTKVFKGDRRYGSALIYVLVPHVAQEDYKSLKGIESLLLFVGIRGPSDDVLRSALSSWTPL